MMIKAKTVKPSRKKIVNHRGICYESTDASIAYVSKKGQVTGKNKGTCYIYVYTENGIYKKVKVRVS